MQAKDRIIVALNMSDLKKALELVDLLRDYVGLFKVGPQLLTSGGARSGEDALFVVGAIQKTGAKVLYDGRFNDPETVAGASQAVAGLGVKMFSLHALADREVIARAVENKGDALVLGTTLLTSFGECECRSIFEDKPANKIRRFASMLVKTGADGIICSPYELGLLSKNRQLLKVALGIPEWVQKVGQQRMMTPGEAIKAGADYLVIDQPITKPVEMGDPIDAAKRIAKEIEQALREKEG